MCKQKIHLKNLSNFFHAFCNFYSHESTCCVHLGKNASEMYDLQIKNLGNIRTLDNVTQLTFEETRTAPIIDNAENYDMSITRFQCDT